MAERFPIDAEAAGADAAALLGVLLGHQLLVERGDEPPAALSDAVAGYDGTIDGSASGWP